MKKLLLATAVATLSFSAAQAAPTVYGKLNVSVDSYNDGKTTITEVNSNASRFGVKGKEKLTDTLSALYQIEWEVSADGSGSTSTDLAQRNRFIGLEKEDLGSVKVGRMDTLFKDAAGKADVFNDYAHADIKEMMYGEERLNNVITLESDRKMLGGLGFGLQTQAGESTTTSAYSPEKRKTLGDGITAAATYENKDMGLTAALVANSKSAGKFNAVNLSGVPADAYRGVVSYDFAAAGLDGLVVNAAYQMAEFSDYPNAPTATQYSKVEEDAWLLSTAYTIGETPWTVKAQYQKSNTDWAYGTTAATTSGSTDAKQWGLGLDYALNSKTKLFASAMQREWNNRRDATTLAAVADVKVKDYGLGMEVKF